MNKISQHSARMVAVALLALGIMSIHSPAWGAKGGGGPMACAEGEGAYFDSATHSWECGVLGDVITKKFVFLTSTTTSGKIIGPGGATGQAGADEICNDLASNSELSNDSYFLAWISGDLGTPDNSFIRHPGPYVLPDGITVVVYNWDDLTNGNLNNPINMYEDGTARGGGEDGVWTGTLPWGEQRLPNCNDWTSDEPGDRPPSGPGGYYGSSDKVIEMQQFWTYYNVEECDRKLRLYCFEQ